MRQLRVNYQILRHFSHHSLLRSVPDVICCSSDETVFCSAKWSKN